MDRHTPQNGDFPTAPAHDWAKCGEAYADLIDDLDIVGDDPAPSLGRRAPGRGRREPATPSRRIPVERRRPFALAR
jgi:hypothetical protein